MKTKSQTVRATGSSPVVNAWGRAEQQLYGGGVKTKAIVEAATGRTTDLQAGSGGTVLNQHYVWDSLNNLTARTDANGDGNTGAVSETFTYADGLNRLTGYQVSAPAIPNLSRTVNLQYNALGMVLSKSDVGDYTYGTQGNGAVRPHALQRMDGAVSGSYTYDANGNVTSSGGSKYSAIAYSSFNLPDSQSGIAGSSNGGSRYTWQYDENHARIKEVRTLNGGNFAGTRTTWNLHPDNQGGLGFESETNTPSSPNGYNVSAISNRHYLSAGGQMIGVLVTTGALPALVDGQTTPPTLASVTVVKLEYWHKDQLGSLISTTDHAGNVTQRYAYDPFGKRRYTNGSYDSFGNVVVNWSAGVNYGTERGFTGHQELDEVGLVHMNGRIFDANLGVFLQGDPLIQDPRNLQNYNRYGYCYSNPLTCSDPSGLNFLDDIFKGGLQLARVLDPGGTYLLQRGARTQWGYTIGSIGIGLASAYWCGMYGGAEGATTCNAIGQTAWAGFAGKSYQEATRIGVVAGITTYAFAAAGDYINNTGTYSSGAYYGQGSPTAVAVHAAVGCGSSVLGGGRCQDGALSAAFSEAVMGNLGPNINSQNLAVRTVISAVVGGTAAELGGGKFSNGAVMGAFSYLFNECLHTRMCGSDSTAVVARAGVAGGSIGYASSLSQDGPSLHFGFDINDGYSVLSIDGAPSTGACFGDRCRLITNLDSSRTLPIVWSETLVPPQGMSGAELAASVKNTMISLSGVVPYSFPSNPISGRFGEGYNSNSIFSSTLQAIYGRPVLGTLYTTTFRGYQAPGYGNLLPGTVR